MTSLFKPAAPVINMPAPTPIAPAPMPDPFSPAALNAAKTAAAARSGRDKTMLTTMRGMGGGGTIAGGAAVPYGGRTLGG